MQAQAKKKILNVWSLLSDKPVCTTRTILDIQNEHN
jgi:hypothetical protein